MALKKHWFWLVIILCALHGAAVLKSYFSVFPQEKLDRPILITGMIVSLPEVKAQSSSFIFQTKYGQVRLSWYTRFSKVDIPSFKPGQKWKFTVKLKAPRGFHNSGVFDYGEYLKQQGIIASGYIYPKKAHVLLDESKWQVPVESVRFSIHRLIDSVVSNPEVKSLIDALLLGDKSGLTFQDKQLFQRTGTSHLIAISGLHIGLVALWIFIIVKFLWSMSVRCVRLYPPQKIAVWASLLGAIIYSLLAGFSLPTQRALIMILVGGYALLSHYQITAKRIWLIAFLLVVLWNPFSIISAGFWLSFLAVAFLLLAFTGRLKQPNRFMRWFYPQIVVLIALIPASIYWFGYFSPVSLFANIVAIPLVSFIVVPLIFISTVLIKLSIDLFPITGWMVEVLIHFLSWLKPYALDYAYFGGADIWVMASAVLGLFIFFLPRGVPGKLLGVALCLPLLFYHPSLSNNVIARFTLLDVGQGLAAVFQSKDKTLVYDAGPVFASGSDAGELVVAPYLRSLGVHTINTLVLSHADSDHIGGYKTLREQFSIDQTYAPFTDYYGQKTEMCEEGKSWQWQGIRFQFLNIQNVPLNDYYQRKPGRNDTSCVLKITVGKNSILLPGDIESGAEAYLLDYHRGQLPSTILVAPHHGSRTSSTQGFIDTVDPKYVLYSAGYKNRYHHPALSVQKRYQKNKSIEINTAHSGAVQFDFYRDGEVGVRKQLSN